MYKEKITILTNTIGNSNDQYKEEDLQTIEHTINIFVEYIQSVVNMETAFQIARFKLDGDDYRRYIENLDRARRINHDACIANMRMINRLCTSYKADKVFTDEELKMDRSKIADEIIIVIVNEYFKERK